MPSQHSALNLEAVDCSSTGLSWMPEGFERGCASRSEKIWFTGRGGRRGTGTSRKVHTWPNYTRLAGYVGQCFRKPVVVPLPTPSGCRKCGPISAGWGNVDCGDVGQCRCGWGERRQSTPIIYNLHVLRCQKSMKTK